MATSTPLRPILAVACLALLASAGANGASAPLQATQEFAATAPTSAAGLTSPQAQPSSHILPGTDAGLLDPILRAVEEVVGVSVLPTEGETFDAPACNYFEPFKPTGAPGRWRPSLRIGVNTLGTFGLGPAVGGGPSGMSVGTGFQMPIGPANENLAIGWWGEGYLFDFTLSGGAKMHYPSGPSVGVVPVDDFYLDSARYTTYRVTVALMAEDTADEDDGLLVDFEFTLDKEKCDVTLRTRVQNQSDFTLDIDYKRVADWDNLNSQSGIGGVFTSSFQVVGNGVVAQRLVGGIPRYECRTTAVGITLPDTIDLWAWDDYSGTTGTGSTWITPSYTGDGNAGFNFQRTGLPPGGTWDTVLVYDCSYLV